MTPLIPSLLALSLSACFSWEPNRYPPISGLRWSGDAVIAGGGDGTALGGPAVRFRVGGELSARPPTHEGKPEPDGPADWLFGTWGGLELSAAVLTGANAGDRVGTLALFGARPWLLRRQSQWFLRTEQVTAVGVLIPEVGVALGLGAGTRLQLGWQVPLGGQHLQVVPGVSWISPGGDQLLLGTIALRVPM